MSANNFSPFQLEDAQIVEMQFSVDLEQIEKQVGNESRFSLQIEVLEGSTEEDSLEEKRQITLGISLDTYPQKKDKRKKPKQITRMSILARGLVLAVFDADISGEERELALRANGISLLYGIIRGYVSTVTALSPLGKLMLPSINPLAVAEESLLKQAEEQAD